MAVINFDLKIVRMDNLKYDEDQPAFGAFLRHAEHDDTKPHTIYLNVSAIIGGDMVDETGEDVTESVDRKQLLISTLMHEFGHALEAHLNMPVNEYHIEKACQDFEALKIDTPMGDGFPQLNNAQPTTAKRTTNQ